MNKGEWSRLTAEEQNRQAGRLLGWWALAAAVVVAAIVVVGQLRGGGHGATLERQHQDARRVCEGFVTDRLKAPSTAQFTRGGVTGTAVDGVTVTGAVDAQNYFGAMVRGTFSCKVRLTGDRWELVALSGAF